MMPPNKYGFKGPVNSRKKI